jgi:hypothetical protein
MPSTLLPRRWALTPPFHPYPHRVPFEDVSKVFLRAITGLRAAGGIFSVALSVNSSTGFSLCFFFAGTFPTRVPPKLHRPKSVLPPPWRYQAHCPSPSGLTAQGYSLLAQSGVRTFLPPSPLARSRPAIVQLTRHSHYIARSGRSSHRDCSPGGTPITSLQVASRIRLPSAPSLPVLSPCRTSTPGLCPLPHSPSSCSLTR